MYAEGAFQYLDRKEAQGIYACILHSQCQFLRGTITEEWARIPDNVEILMTHTPPHGILDITKREKHAGCEALATRISSLENCRLHIFGHIHEGFGAEIRETEKNGKLWETVYVNAAIAMRNLPIIVDLKKL